MVILKQLHHPTSKVTVLLIVYGKVVNYNSNDILEYKLVPPYQHQALTIAILDTDATLHYISTKAQSNCTNITPNSDGPSIQVSSIDNIKSPTIVQIPLSYKISIKSQEGHIFNKLNGYLISIGKLCDEYFVALFTNNHINIYKDGDIINEEQSNRTNGLCNIPFSIKTAPTVHLISPPKHIMNIGAIKDSTTQCDDTALLHGCAFIPLFSTFLREIKIIHFASFTNRTDNLVKKQLPKSTVTIKGHKRMEQKISNQPKS